VLDTVLDWLGLVCKSKYLEEKKKVLSLRHELARRAKDAGTEEAGEDD